MHISIADPFFQTSIFILILVIFTVITLKKDQNPHEMDFSHTDELKGVAILMVIFSHIGYFLFSDHKFLFPLSVCGGVGVNLFLFLSGFGLTRSEIKSEKSVIGFYKKRLRNLFIPMWAVLILTLALDYFLLGKVYKLPVVTGSFLGFFPVSDIDSAINSPMWYFTLILFYYLIFPLVFRRNRPVLSVAILILVSIFTTRLNLPVTKDLLKLYQLHNFAFPLGVAFAFLNEKKIGLAIKATFQKLLHNTLLLIAIRYITIGILLFIFGYTSIHSGIGKSVSAEQTVSIITMASLVLLFLLKSFHSRLFIIFGIYSYEIYLIQWPILYRYDFIYQHTSASVGTLLYLALFVLIGFILKRALRLVIKTG